MANHRRASSDIATVLLGMCALCACVRPADAAPPAPAAAATLAHSFAPEIVGAMVPAASRVPHAGEYAMSLTMSFTTFITMEMRVDAHLKGAMRLTLAPDGTASVCLGARHHGVVAGQYHYEPPEKREHSESNDVRLVALVGRWSVVDGVATIDFDRVGWNSCDLTKAKSPTTSQLRCIAFDPTERIPIAGLACEASELSELRELGMPMTTAPKKEQPPDQPPSGAQLVLAAPGVVVDVDQDRRAAVPTFTFKAASVAFVEDEYRPKP